LNVSQEQLSVEVPDAYVLLSSILIFISLSPVKPRHSADTVKAIPSVPPLLADLTFEDIAGKLHTSSFALEFKFHHWNGGQFYLSLQPKRFVETNRTPSIYPARLAEFA
jgi:hypothetical protein